MMSLARLMSRSKCSHLADPVRPGEKTPLPKHRREEGFHSLFDKLRNIERQIMGNNEVSINGGGAF